MANDVEQNKQNVLAFYDLMFNACNPAEAMEKYAGPVYIEHSPKVADGKEAFIAHITQLAREYPGKRVHFQRVIAEGDTVVVHSRHAWPGDDDWAAIDIFRLENGKIVEHWDVNQCVPEQSANPNTMF